MTERRFPRGCQPRPSCTPQVAPKNRIIKWPVLRILSSATPFSLFDLPLLVVDPGNTRLRAGHREAVILNAHFLFCRITSSPRDPPSSNLSDTCASTLPSCSMVEGLSLARVSVSRELGKSVIRDFRLRHYIAPFIRRSENVCMS